MPRYDFNCQRCGTFEAICSIDNRVAECPHCRTVSIERLVSTTVGITGTRDNFGINKSFKDKGKEIDNWKSWEKAGYREPLNVTRDKNVRQKIKGKIDKMKRESGAKVTI